MDPLSAISLPSRIRWESDLAFDGTANTLLVAVGGLTWAMKSAYELAMERLEKKAPSLSLSPEQKAQIAEIDSTFKARIAERELFLKGQIEQAREAGKLEEADTLQKQLAIDVRRLQEDAEAKKEKTRASFSL